MKIGDVVRRRDGSPICGRAMTGTVTYVHSDGSAAWVDTGFVELCVEAEDIVAALENLDDDEQNG